MSGENGTVLIVDDNSFVLDSTALLLEGYNYKVKAVSDPLEALKVLERDSYEAVLTDIKMPRLTGIELLERIRTFNREIPVILMTAYAEFDMAVNAVKKGAFDFLLKPYNPDYLLHSIEKAVKYFKLLQMEKNYKLRLEEDVIKRTRELAEALKMVKEMNQELIHRITAVAEYRDTDTGYHIRRIGLYCQVVCESLGMPVEFTETVRFASAMHDIGKIGIPDSILLKPGGLTRDEFEIMKGHTTIGEKMLADSPYPNIQTASSIALNHHERWDGSGYPRGLKGEDIPVEGRIVMLVDQYDALRSRRPYKKELSHEETSSIILEGDGRTMPAHFDPKLLTVFKETATEFQRIFDAFKD